MQAISKTILAATDMSRGAFAAVRRAALIARQHDARLEIVYVIPDALRSAAWNELPKALIRTEAERRSATTENLDAIARQIESEYRVKVSAALLHGRPSAEIAARGESANADLIVVGGHGENIVTTPIIGTTAHRVLRTARKPVLLVKRTPALDHGGRTNYGHLVIATDFSKDSAQAARTARWLFPEAAVTLFHSYEAPFEAKLSGRLSEAALEDYRQRALEQAHEELVSFAASVDLSDVPRVVRHGLPAARIREYAAEIGSDLIAIGSEERGRLETALLGSVSLDVISQASCDVLLARA